MNDSKPIIINSIIGNESFGFLYKDENSNLKLFNNDYSLSYKELAKYDNQFIIDDLNDNNELERIYGIGNFFKLKDKSHIYTYMNNAYGCAGTDLDDSEINLYDSYQKKIYQYHELKTVEGLKCDDISEIYDTYSFKPGYGLKTYFLSNDRKRVYVSGKIEDIYYLAPVKVIELEENYIKRCGSMDYGGFLYLLSDGRLYYWGDNDKNTICSNQDKSYIKNGPILLGYDIEDIWVMANLCIYKRGINYYFFGYSRSSYSKFPLGLDSKSNTRYPFPGEQLRHLPFSDPDNIKQLMIMKYGVGVLLNNGYLYITGRDQQFNIEDEKCKLIEVEGVNEIAFTNGYVLGYRKDGIYYHTSDGNKLSQYMYRPHIYHPSIAMI